MATASIFVRRFPGAVTHTVSPILNGRISEQTVNHSRNSRDLQFHSFCCSQQAFRFFENTKKWSFLISPYKNGKNSAKNAVAVQDLVRI
jgi:hypothetical protein